MAGKQDKTPWKRSKRTPRISSANKEKQNCAKCSSIVANDDLALQCDECDLWQHLGCTGLRPLTYDALENDPCDQVLFFCTACATRRKNERFQRTISVTKYPVSPRTASENRLTMNTRKRHKASSSPFANSTEVLRSNSSTHVDMDIVRPDANDDPSEEFVLVQSKKRSQRKIHNTSDAEIGIPKSTSAGVPSTSYAKALKSGIPSTSFTATTGLLNANRIHQTPLPSENTTAHQTSGRAPREHCLMLFNINESIKTTPVDRHADDLEALRNIIDKLLDLDDPGVSLKALIRIGIRREGDDVKPRPIRAVFTGPEDPVKLLKRSYKIREEPFQIRPDRSPEDREKMRVAVTQLKNRLQSGETNLTIRNFQVVPMYRLLRQPVLLPPRGTG